MPIVTDEMRNKIKDNINKAMALYSKHDFLALSNYETDDFIKRQIDNFHDLECRGLEENISKFIVIDIFDVYQKNDINISIKFNASLEKYIINKETGEVVDGVREYIIKSTYEARLEKNNTEKIEYCNSCGAKINPTVPKCQYCGTPVFNKEVEWLISDLIEIKTNDFHAQYTENNRKYNDEQWKKFQKDLNTKIQNSNKIF